MRRQAAELVAAGNLRLAITALAANAWAAKDSVLGTYLDEAAMRLPPAKPRMTRSGESQERPTIGDLLDRAREELKRNDGVVAVEFGLILAGIGLPMILGGELLGPRLLQWLQNVDSAITIAQALLVTLGGACPQ